MQILTFRLKPKALFGVILALTGVIVIIVTFVSNHSKKAEQVSASVSCSTAQERADYLSSLGWEFDTEQQKKIIIPAQFNKVYENYNEIQRAQGFDLSPYKGKSATVYTYAITNYKDNDKVIANLIVCDGKLIGSDLCDPSAEDGFLIALGENDGKT